MPQINIQNFFQSDTQEQLVSKLNSNFNSIANYDGSAFSDRGPTGDRGMIGARGPQGATGNTGKRGNRWFAQAAEPDGDFVTYGDLWIDESFNAYIFSETGWTSIGSFKRDQGLFKNVTGVLNSSGNASGTAIAINDVDPSKYCFVFSDDLIADSGNINPLGAKFMIASNPSKNGGFPLEFARFDSTYTGPTGNATDVAKHPFFAWKGADVEENLELRVPSGNTFFSFSEGRGKDLDISAINDITFSSGATAFVGVRNNLTFNTGLDFSINASDAVTLSFPSGSPTNIFLDGNILWFKTAPVNLFPVYQKSDGYVKIERTIVTSETTTSQNSPIFLNSPDFNYWVNTSYLYTDTRRLAEFRTIYNGVTYPAFKAIANGKVFTKKTSERYDRPSNLPVFTPSGSSTVSNRANWYALPTLKSANGRTIFINPQNTAVGSPTLATGGTGGNYIGIGFNKTDWSSDNLLQTGEMITYRVICGRSSFPTDYPSLSGFSMIGFWTTTRPTTLGTNFAIFSTSVSDLNICTEVDIHICRSSATTFDVRYRAYSIDSTKGGWYGNFTIS
jgi:hypothetical protein